MRKTVLSAIACSVIFTACGGSGSSNPIQNQNDSQDGAQVLDSQVANLDYETPFESGVTDEDGYFEFSPEDKNVTFKIGEMKIATFELSKLKPDKKIFVGELLGLDRNDTTDQNLINLLRFLQTLDSDNNPDNGIQITDEVKYKINDLIDSNDTVKVDFFDNNLTVLENIAKDLNKTLVLERTARSHYAKTLEKYGYTPTKMPFITVWEVGGDDKSITIPINPDYAGEYNYTVDWGDGNVSKYVDGNATHTYANDGNYTVKITGDFPVIYLNNDGEDDFFNKYDYVGNADKLIDIKKWGDIEWKSFKKAFAGDNSLQKISATDTPNLKNVNEMSYAFAGCTKFNSDINDWNVSNVTDMSWLFGNAKKFNQPLNNWDVSNVTNMSYMFFYTSFNQPLNNWDVSNVTDMSGMFLYTSFNQPLNNWDVSNVTDMSGMFDGAGKFNQPLNNWDVSNVTTMERMFSFTMNFNQPLNNWDVSNVTNMKEMFEFAYSFNQPLDEWNVSNVKNMHSMFLVAKSFDQNISMWDVTNVIDYDYFAESCPIDGTDKMPHFK
ncbi:BspA family leucine-rich repeat surface protein [Nitratifractor sp.]